jgi:RNA polymerase sigma factor (sigma-70 family)
MTMHGTGEPTSATSTAVWDAAADSFRRWRNGDRGALEELVRVMSPVLWHVVRATGLGRADAEEVVQTTWLALVRSAESISDAQAVTRWLCTTARREAWRAGRRDGRVRLAETDVLDDRLPREHSAEHEVVLDDERARLWQAVDRLPERCRRLLRIVAAEPRPDYTAIATDLQMPIGSIGPTRGRCLGKLRDELATKGALS